MKLMVLNAGIALALLEMGINRDDVVVSKSPPTIEMIPEIPKATFIDNKPYKPWGKKFRREFR